MKYDDATWHSGGDFPSELPASAGATHIGMFVAWCILNNLGGEDFEPASIEDLRQQRSTPGAWFLAVCDGKFLDDDLSEEGRGFANHYYQSSDLDYGFMHDYCEVTDEDPEEFDEAIVEGPSIYEVPDSWATYERLAPVLQARFDSWKAGGH